MKINLVTWLLNVPKEVDLTDLSLIRVETERASQALALQVARAAAFVIHDSTTYALAEHYIKEVKAVTDSLEEKRDSYVKPLKQAIKVATDDVRPRLTTAAQIEQILKQKCLEYRANVAAMRAKAEAEAQKLLASIAAPVEEKRAALIAITQAVTPITAGVAYPKSWKGTVTNPALVPDRYWTRVLSQATIDLDVANGVREIAGVEIKEHETMSVNFRK